MSQCGWSAWQGLTQSCHPPPRQTLLARKARQGPTGQGQSGARRPAAPRTFVRGLGNVIARAASIAAGRTSAPGWANCPAASDSPSTVQAGSALKAGGCTKAGTTGTKSKSPGRYSSGTAYYQAPFSFGRAGFLLRSCIQMPPACTPQAGGGQRKRSQVRNDGRQISLECHRGNAATDKHPLLSST